MRLLKGAKGLRDLLMTMVFSFPALLNVGSLLFLVVFMCATLFFVRPFAQDQFELAITALRRYAVLGMNIFSFVMHGENLTDDRNFESFGSSMLLLFQQLTGDGWCALAP